MDNVLNVKMSERCRWDAASLGEIMLRLDPGDGRIHTARGFKVWEGELYGDSPTCRLANLKKSLGYL